MVKDLSAESVVLQPAIGVPRESCPYAEPHPRDESRRREDHVHNSFPIILTVKACGIGLAHITHGDTQT